MKYLRSKKTFFIWKLAKKSDELSSARFFATIENVLSMILFSSLRCRKENNF